VIERCIIDKVTVIGKGSKIGKMQDMGDLGITVVGKNTHVPPGFTIGRSVILGTDLDIEDFDEFTDKTIPNGKKVSADKKKLV
jgi:glucose-1-phosphate adenylyltransferase